MKTVSYNDVLYRAAELAGRTRDKIPLSEATMLQGFIAAALEDVWNMEVWPELNVLPMPAVNPVNQLFTKNEGQPGEIGDILGIWSADPSLTTKARAVEFAEMNGQVWVGEVLAQVFVDAMVPALDLTDADAPTLAAAQIPRRFRSYLAYRAAGELLTTERPDLAAAYLSVAAGALAGQRARLSPVAWWRNVRVRTGYGRNCSVVAGP